VRLTIVLFVSLLAAAVSLQSAVVIVRSDEAMIRMAPAIVTGTVLEIYPRHDDRGDIETVTRIVVDGTIKGDVPVGEIVDVVQFGGSLDGRFQAESGAPRYEVGARYLVVLDRNGRGLWTTFDLALGQFRFLTRDGKQLLARDTSEIVGWSQSGEPFYDSDRSAPEFLAFAREVVKRTDATATVLHPAPLVLDFDLKSVTQSAVNIWTGGASAMNDTVSATPASGDAKNLTDGESRVIADDPHADVPGTFNGSGIIAVAFFGCTGCAPSLKNGETYISIDQMDVVVNDGVSSSTISAGNFLSTMVHEIGHTWGFRHSDKNASEGPCSSPLPCDSGAIMRSSLVSGLNGTLQNWDKDAANEVYGDGTRQATFTGTQYVSTLGGQPPRRPSGTSWRISQAACTAPSISTQPQSQTINSGQQANLSVVAAGTAPFTYLWYTGTPPSGPVAPGPNNNAATYNPSPPTTTTYWVRVFGCSTSIDSAVATVTVNQTGCTPPSISTQPSGSTITAGQFANLSVVAAGTGPFTYQWYIGNPPNTATPFGTGQSINVSPTQTTSYWVRVTGQCSPPADSNAAVVTVSAGCTQPTIINQPQDQQITSGTSTSLFVGYTGSVSTVTWYRGVQNDTTNPVGSGQSFITGPLTTTTQYWALVSNSCGSAPSRTVTVSVATACVAPNITLVDAAPKNVLPGGLVTLTAQATGTSLQFQWYRGVAPDLSNPVAGASTATATDTPLVSTSYFVRVSNSCGSQNSGSIAIAVGAACTPPSIATITDDTTISSNMTVTLAVTATGDATLHYQWYRGPAGDTSTPVGADSATFTTPALFSDAQFWVKVSNACTPAANSRSVNVAVIPARHRAARH
jgi:Ig-like domain CHU_C associated